MSIYPVSKKVVTDATVYPVTLAEAKTQLRITDDNSDTLLNRLIKTATKAAETDLNRAIVRQKWRLYFNHFFNDMRVLPHTVREIDQIQYVDLNSATQTVAAATYTFDLAGQRVLLGYNQNWPATRAFDNDVWIDVWSGYYDETASPVNVTSGIPEDVKQAVLMLVYELYQNPGAEQPFQSYENRAYKRLLAHHWMPHE